LDSSVFNGPKIASEILVLVPIERKSANNERKTSRHIQPFRAIERKELSRYLPDVNDRYEGPIIGKFGTQVMTRF